MLNLSTNEAFLKPHFEKINQHRVLLKKSYLNMP
jgi:hypothetical protein